MSPRIPLFDKMGTGVGTHDILARVSRLMKPVVATLAIIHLRYAYLVQVCPVEESAYYTYVESLYNDQLNNKCECEYVPVRNLYTSNSFPVTIN